MAQMNKTANHQKLKGCYEHRILLIQAQKAKLLSAKFYKYLCLKGTTYL